jgi:hypothetical protein
MEHMEILHTAIDLMVPTCIEVEGIVFLESWGLHIEKENFLTKECLPGWVDPTKG